MVNAGASTDVAVDELWSRYGSRLTRFASLLVGPGDAGDVAADAFYASVPALRTGRVQSEESYLYRAVTNRAHDVRRSRQRRWRRQLQAVPPRSIDGPDSFVDVRRAVAALSVNQRAVVFLVYWEDRTERDIAELLDVSPGTVRRHLVRARDHLRKALS